MRLVGEEIESASESARLGSAMVLAAEGELARMLIQTVGAEENP
jgi:hypothetical protein